MQGQFRRIQCTPDLLPSDIIGTQIYDAKKAAFTTQLGPVHANIVLLDEINRSSAKTQSAMLEAMQERQTSIGGTVYKLPVPFLVIATQNPIEQEGTYLLPEAQLDRFLLKEVLDYPDTEDELEILTRIDSGVFDDDAKAPAGLTLADVLFLQEAAKKVFAQDSVRDYLVAIVQATRHADQVISADLARLVDYGASPRASIAFLHAARALALLAGRALRDPRRREVARPPRAAAPGRADVRGRRARDRLRAGHRRDHRGDPVPVAGPDTAMAALLPRVKSRLFIHANRRSTNLLEGEYAAITAGRSLDFDDLREYVPGDEVDDIDWKATARTGSPLVKRYKQTRRQDVILAVDTGRGMAAASQGGSPKRDVAILIAGALGYLSLRHGDAVGLITRVGRSHAAPPAARQRGVPRDPAAQRRAGDPARRRPERPVRAVQLPAARHARIAASSSSSATTSSRRPTSTRRCARCARSTNCSGSPSPTST